MIEGLALLTLFPLRPEDPFFFISSPAAIIKKRGTGKTLAHDTKKNHMKRRESFYPSQTSARPGVKSGYCRTEITELSSTESVISSSHLK
jgi:hypothetical protein